MTASGSVFFPTSLNVKKAHLILRRSWNQAFTETIAFIPFNDGFHGTSYDRARLRSATAGLVARYINAIQLNPAGPKRVEIDPDCEQEVWMLKQLTWHYVITNQALATQQFGQRCVVRNLFQTFHDAAQKGNARLFPFAFRERLEARPDSFEIIRVVADYIAGMTERQALELHKKLTGVAPGSALH